MHVRSVAHARRSVTIKDLYADSVRLLVEIVGIQTLIPLNSTEPLSPFYSVCVTWNLDLSNT